MKIKKIAAIFLTAVIGASCFTSCKDENNSTDSSSAAQPPVEYTDYSLVADEQSDYTVVVSDTASKKAKTGQSEIVKFFYDATGCILPQATDETVSYSAEAKLILVGDTKYTEKAGVNVSEIPAQGFVIKTVDSNVFILGGDAYGELWGVYEFLHQTIGYECYAPSAIALDKDVKNLRLQKFNFSDAPDIQWRYPSYGTTYSNEIGRNRMRLSKDMFLTSKADWMHNCITEYFPEATYKTDYPEFYAIAGSTERTQICYTARGDAEKLELLKSLTVERMKELVNMYYEQGDYRTSISFMQQDGTGWCNCDSCQTVKAQHGGTNSSLAILFLNDVAARINAWMAETWPGYSLQVLFFAYSASIDAPVKTENGVYVPVSEAVRCHPNVSVMLAPLTANFLVPLTDSKNTVHYENIKKWQSVCSKMYFWFYDTNFTQYFSWYDSFNALPSLYKLTNEMSDFIFNQGAFNASTLTRFDELKQYLNAKLAWDVNADCQQLIQNYFDFCYGDASQAMMQYFTACRSWTHHLTANNLISGRVLNVRIDSTQYPKQVLVAWQGFIDEAYKAIAPLRLSDVEEYTTIYNRITRESLAIRLALITLHENTYEAAVFKTMQSNFKADADKLGFTKYGENRTLSATLYSTWNLD